MGGVVVEKTEERGELASREAWEGEHCSDWSGLSDFDDSVSLRELVGDAVGLHVIVCLLACLLLLFLFLMMRPQGGLESLLYTFETLFKSPSRQPLWEALEHTRTCSHHLTTMFPLHNAHLEDATMIS